VTAPEPPCLAEVFEWMNMIAFTGQSFEDGSSFFVGNLGKRLLGENFTLADDALDPEFLPFPFDIEGMPKRVVTLVDRGVIRTPVLDKAWADRLGLEPTASAWLGSPSTARRFIFRWQAATRRGRDDRVDEARIWITRFNYVNGLLEPKTALMTGTTRDGTFLIATAGLARGCRTCAGRSRWPRRSRTSSRCRRNAGSWGPGTTCSAARSRPVVKIRGWNITGSRRTQRDRRVCCTSGTRQC
jgi:hypothetical protein